MREILETSFIQRGPWVTPSEEMKLTYVGLRHDISSFRFGLYFNGMSQFRCFQWHYQWCAILIYWGASNFVKIFQMYQMSVRNDPVWDKKIDLILIPSFKLYSVHPTKFMFCNFDFQYILIPTCTFRIGNRHGNFHLLGHRRSSNPTSTRKITSFCFSVDNNLVNLKPFSTWKVMAENHQV